MTTLSPTAWHKLIKINKTSNCGMPAVDVVCCPHREAEAFREVTQTSIPDPRCLPAYACP